MSRYVARPYEGADDLPSLIRFAQKITAAQLPLASYYHSGDFVWQLYPFDDSDDVRIWRSATGEGRVVACAIFEPAMEYRFAIEPGIDDEAVLMAAIVEWAEGRRALAPNKDEIYLAVQSRGTNTLSTSALESDTARIAFLEEDGYTRHEGATFCSARDLTGTLPAVVLPEGAAFRAISEADEAARAELHRDAWSVWGESKHSIERYQRLRAAPLYDPELDVVLESDGQLVSYCVCWLDTENRIGLFEPVGTRPSAIRRGFGRMVLYEAFRRLRDKGMRTAIVNPGSVNAPAMALYASAGFETVEREYVYLKAD